MAKMRTLLQSYGLITLGDIIYAFAFQMFYAPNDIAFGGFTGIAQVIHRLFGLLPVGTTLILMNLPLFIIVLSSTLLDLFGLIDFPHLREPILASIFGGVCLGLGMGLIYLGGASMGGTDLTSRLIRLRHPHLSMGKMIMLLDFVVISLVSLVFGQLESALFGLLAIFVSGSMMDKVLFGADPSKVAYIITEEPEAVAQKITDDLQRGVTIIPGRGAYTGAEKGVLLCAFKSRQIVELKRRVHDIDPKAFLIVCEAYEVLGVGFLPHELKKK